MEDQECHANGNEAFSLSIINWEIDLYLYQTGLQIS